MIPVESGPQLQLRDYVRVLWRRRLSVFAITVVLAAGAFVYEKAQTPVYQGVAEVLLESRTIPDVFDSSGTPLAGSTSELVETQIRIIEGQAVRDAVTKRLGRVPGVTASQVGGTPLVQLKVESTIPAAAAKIADSYADAYIEFRRQRAIDDTLSASQQIRNKISDLQKQIDDLDAKVAAVPVEIQPAVREQNAPQKDALVQQKSLFQQKLDQLQVDSAIRSGPELVTSASVPSSPVRPRPARTAVLAGVLGLLLGLAQALVREQLDDTVKGRSDLERVARGLPLLSVIPHVRHMGDKPARKVISIADPNSAAAEAYRGLRTALTFIALEHPVKTLQVTSPGPREGKTTTVANLGVALAKSGQRVVLVDCDLRRPRLHNLFGVDNEVGFTSVLLGKASISTAVKEVGSEGMLALLASGPLPPNPSELLASPRTVQVFKMLESVADVILVDSPPVLPVTDALVLSGHVDAMILVTMTGETTRGRTARTVELLRQFGAPVRGTVLNGQQAQQTDSYYGASYYAAANGSANGNGASASAKKRQPPAPIT